MTSKYILFVTILLIAAPIKVASEKSTQKTDFSISSIVADVLRGDLLNLIDRMNVGQLSLIDQKAADDSEQSLGVDSNDTHTLTKKFARVVEHFVNDVLWDKAIFALFTKTDFDNSGNITRNELEKLLENQKLSEDDLNHLIDVVLPEGNRGALSFKQFDDVVQISFLQQLAKIGFSIVTDSNDYTSNARATFAQIANALQHLWELFDGAYPDPAASGLGKSLMKKCDADQDGQLDYEEFYWFISLYMKYYRSYLSNSAYETLVFKDDFVERYWKEQEWKRDHAKWLNFYDVTASQHIKMLIFDQVFNQKAFELFSETDVNGDHVLSLGELKSMLKPFKVSEPDIEFVFAAADINNNGNLEYGEFCGMLRGFLMRSLGIAGWNILTEYRDLQQKQAFKAFFDYVLSRYELPLSQAELYAKLDEVMGDAKTNKDGLITYPQWMLLMSKYVDFLRMSVLKESNFVLEANTQLQLGDKEDLVADLAGLGYNKKLVEDLRKNIEEKMEAAREENQTEEEFGPALLNGGDQTMNNGEQGEAAENGEASRRGERGEAGN